MIPTIANLRMLASLKGRVWGIRPDAVEHFALAALDVPAKSELDLDMSDFYDLREPYEIDGDNVGHVSVKGVLMDSAPRVYEKLGLATLYETIGEELEAVESEGADAIVMHVNSPGGTVAGNAEACDAIASVGVPIVAHCKGLACSAAYKLSAVTDGIIATQSAEVGNIGTILSWADCDEFWREMGVEWKALTNEGADLKSTFHLEPDETQLAFLQESIDEAGADFRRTVEKGRGAAGAEVDAEVFRAGWYSGKRAGKLGLIDQIGTAGQAQKFARRLTR